jgi:hypothetical protein
MPQPDINALVLAAQGTNISTGVTCHARHGQITTQAMDAIAGAENAFIVTNNRVTAGSVIVAHVNSTASAGTPILSVGTIGAGVFTITVTNLHATNALDNTAIISFLVLK